MCKKNYYDYLIEKRLEVLEAIKPMCEAFNITDYDYEINTEIGSEYLRIGGTKIGCNCNSIWAVQQELVGWIFLIYWKDRAFGEHIRQHWQEGE